MTIEWLSSKRMQGVTADTKPTNVPTGTEFMNTETRVLSVFNGTSWDDVSGGGGSTNLDGLTDVDLTTDTPDNGDVLTYTTTGTKWVPTAPPGAGGGITASSADTLTNKGINLSNNTITDTSRATGDIPKDNGTKYVRLARGSANQFLKVNTGGTDIGYETLDVTLDTNAITTTNTKTMINKTIDADSNTITNIENADIKAAAGIVWSKISKSGSVLGDIADTSLGSLAQYDLIMRNGSSQWARLAKGSNSTALTVDASGVVAYTTITNAMLAGSIAYSKLTLSNSIVNADINSSAAIVTSKLADSANFILKTLDNAFGAHYQDFTKMTAPSNPGANDIRLYVDTTDTHLKIKNSAGTVVDLHSAGGSGAPTDAQYITLATNGTLSAERVLTAGTNIAVVDGGAGSTATLNVPNASTTEKGAVELATDGEIASSVAVQGSDARLVRDLYEEMKTRTQVGELDIQDARWGSGMFLSQPTAIGSSTGWTEDAEGLYRYYGTGTTSGTKAGNITNTNIFRRQFKPHVYFIFKLAASTTNHAMFLGLSSSNAAAETHATAPLANLSGIGLVVLTNQANYQIAHNSGGASATLVNTGITKGTTIKSFEVKNANDDSNWDWNLNDNEASGTITSTVPAQTTDLYATWHNINASTTDLFLYIYKIIGKVTIL